YPGDNLVDWVLVDSYGTSQYPTFQTTVGDLYNFLKTNSNTQHNYLSKPWGVGEFSIRNTTQPVAYSYYDSLKASLDNNSYPNLKAYIVFDAIGGNAENRVAYGANDVFDQI